MREAHRSKLNPALATPSKKKFDQEKMELCKVESEELSEDLSQDDSENGDAYVSNFVAQGIDIASVGDSDGRSQNMK